MADQEKIQLMGKQLHALAFLENNITEEVLYGGGARSGKTKFAVIWVALNCLMYPGSSWYIGRKQLKDIKATIGADFIKQLRSMGLRDGVHYKYDKIDHYIEFYNGEDNQVGSTVAFLPLQLKPGDATFEGLGGLEFTGGVLDESQDISAMARSALAGRMTRRVGKYPVNNTILPAMRGGVFDNGDDTWKFPCKKVLCTCNPGVNWTLTDFYDLWDKGHMNSQLEFSDLGKYYTICPDGSMKNSDMWQFSNKYLPTYNDRLAAVLKEAANPKYNLDGLTEDKKEAYSRRAFIKALPEDNQFLPKDYVSSAKRTMLPAKYKQVIEGDWRYSQSDLEIVDSISVMDAMSIVKIIPEQKDRIIMSVDIGLGRDDSTFIIFKGNKLLKCIVEKTPSTDIVTDRIIELYNQYGMTGKSVVVDAIGAGEFTDTKALSGKIIRFKSNFKVINTHDGNTNYKNLRSQCYAKLGSMLRARTLDLTEMDIEDQNRLRREIAATEYTSLDDPLAVRPKKEIKKILGNSPDIADGIMQVMYFKLKKPINLDRVRNYASRILG